VIKGSLAKRYARALMEIGREQGVHERLGDELATVAGVIEEDEHLRVAVKTPIIPREAWAAIIEKVCEAMGAHDVSLRFLKLLNDKGRLPYLEQISAAYQDLIDETAGRVRADVISATPLAGDGESRIKAALTKITGKEVIMSVEVDESLIGGIVARVAGKLLDGSVATQLRAMEDKLKTAGEL